MRRRMTFEEFLKLLGRAEWKILPTGHITVEDDNQCCPFLFVRDRIPGVVTAGPGFGFNRGQLFSAADNEYGHDPEIRRRLLEACDLKETA